MTLSYLLISCVLAQASDSLSIEQCVAIAKSHNLNVKIAGSAVRAANLGKTVAGKALLPQFKFAAGASYAPWSLKFGYDPAVSNGGEMGARVIAEQTIYDGGMRSLDIRRAGLNSDYEGVVYRKVEVDLEYEVRNTFIELLRAQQEQVYKSESTARLSDYYDLVKRLNAAGTVGYTDLLSAQAELTNARTTSLAAMQAVTIARYRLAEVMGTPDDTSFAAEGALDDLLVIAEDISEPVPAVDVAANLDRKAAELDYNRSQIEISQIRAEKKPSVSLVGDIGALTSRQNLQMPASERFNSFGYSVGLGVEIPLWDWGARKGRIQQSVMESHNALDRMKIVDQAIVTRYRMLRTQMDNAAQRLKSIGEMLETARQNYALFTAKYADGYASAYEVLSAERFLTDTYLSQIETLAEIQSLRAQYDQLAGKGQEETE